MYDENISSLFSYLVANWWHIIPYVYGMLVWGSVVAIWAYHILHRYIIGEWSEARLALKVANRIQPYRLEAHDDYDTELRIAAYNSKEQIADYWNIIPLYLICGALLPIAMFVVFSSIAHLPTAIQAVVGAIAIAAWSARQCVRAMRGIKSKLVEHINDKDAHK